VSFLFLAYVLLFFSMPPPPPISPLFPYTTLFRSVFSFALQDRPPLPTIARFCVPQARRRAEIMNPEQVQKGEETAVHRLLVGLRSEEHTSELQSRSDLVCRLLLEKKKKKINKKTE